MEENKDEKITYKKYYDQKNWKKFKGRKFCRHYGLSKYTFNLLWTALWFIFIAGMAAMFNTAGPIWLLLFWMLGYKW